MSKSDKTKSYDKNEKTQVKSCSNLKIRWLQFTSKKICGVDLNSSDIDLNNHVLKEFKTIKNL